ncbi:hypothetical protein N7492_000413 [Penicillium capsulatum]|uniref:Non-structural maintenance of chromosomes element 4 n=1 Tax=Penicillium capsulatum TaxID=69766 RepID=A0A9W9M012_9EURO|nr:hypothetical protein N7492_000413 [Penicillium capsulatum]KAJ6130524.1 hypothetical protein N7512_003304 [Penicillium capsulatum]
MANDRFSQLQEASQMSSPPSSPRSSSDKENPRRVQKQSTARMAPRQSSKRRRLGEHAGNSQSQFPSSQRNNDKKYYDPDQDTGERRRVRKEFRELSRRLNDSHGEYLQTGNDGLHKTVAKANQLFSKVKQTSDATIDSRLLVNAADLSHKKTAQLALGDSNIGIDVDEFVSKTISFMRRGPGASSLVNNASQRRRHRQSQRDPDGSDDDDHGDAMNWDWHGRMVCFPSNSRPSVSGWLLGPLSVQKRTRQATQRMNSDEDRPTQVVEPNDLHQQDLDQQESSNLTKTCSEIHKLLAKTQRDREDKVESILMARDNPSPEEVQRVMDENNIADNGGIPLFQFCINPKSFGQSVENLFYVSFLVRDGHAGVTLDGRGLPTLSSAIPHAPSEAQRMGIQKHQAVFSLDFETFHELVEVFNIQDPIIPHREETQQTSSTWYG